MFFIVKDDEIYLTFDSLSMVITKFNSLNKIIVFLVN